MKEYTVKRGDTLWSIAKKYLGDGARYKEIRELNNLKSDVIYVGQVIQIPVIDYAALGKLFRETVDKIAEDPSVVKLLEMIEKC